MDLLLLTAAILAQTQPPGPRACPPGAPVIIVENLTILPFESGSAALSARWREHIGMFLRSYRNPPRQIELIGNADRVGGRRANLRLALRRADAVRDHLISLGFPADRIHVRANGEDHPVLETADGVAESQNRIVWMTAMPDNREPRPC